MTTARRSALLVTIGLLLLSSVAAAGDETIDRVKDLYRTAAYEEALAVLDQMAKDQASPSPTEAGEYRLLCLIALERRTEAHDAIAAMVNADPFYQPSQVSPRVRTMFRDVRQSLLPGIAQRAYANAKAAFDRKDPKSSTQFEHVLTLLDDPDVAGIPTLSDLRTVVSAFRDLSNALARQPEPAPARVVAAAPASASAGAAAPPIPVVYREGEPDLLAPEVLNQTLPRWSVPSALSGPLWRDRQGVLEVLIDENGDVISATLRKSFHPAYDAQLVKAAMGWKYKPAQKGGVPVRFLKLVNVRLDN